MVYIVIFPFVFLCRNERSRSTMDISLKENLIKLSRNMSDNEAMTQIIIKFQPLIKSLATRLKYDCSETDLVIFLIELSRDFHYDEKKEYLEGQLVKYFVRALKYKAIDLYRKNKNRVEVIHVEEILDIPENISYMTSIMLLQSIRKLSTRQQIVVVKKFFYGYSEIEIASMLGISRQAVNKIKRRAIKKLKQF